MFACLKPAPELARLPPERLELEYRRLRWQVFAGIVGYAAYYLVRKNLALAIPDILHDYPHYTKAQLGTALTGLSIAYGVSKFLMGSVSDKSNPRWFMPLGLGRCVRRHGRVLRADNIVQRAHARTQNRKQLHLSLSV